MHTPETLNNLLKAGAGLRIDAKSVSINTLNELAASAQSHRAPLIIFNANHILKETIERLAVVGGQSIHFEL